MKENKNVWEKEIQCEMGHYGTTTVTVDIDFPLELGAYRLEASMIGIEQQPVSSVRDFNVVDVSTMPFPVQNVFASSTYDAERHPATMTLTADIRDYWSSDFHDENAWIMFDLGEQKTVGRLIIHWERAHALKFDIKVSKDAETWTEVFKQDKGQGADETVEILPVECRYLRINCREKAMKQFGCAIYFVEVFQE